MGKIIRPSTLEEAFKERVSNSEARYLAGGTLLLGLMGEYKDTTPLIDLSGLNMHAITMEGDRLFIGASVTFEELINSPLVPTGIKESAAFMASLPKRFAATVGGNIASLRDDSYLIPVLLSYKAKIRAWGAKGDHEALLSDYVKKGGCTCIIQGVYIDPTVKAKVKRISLTSTSHAAVTVAVSSIGEGFAIKGSGLISDATLLDKIEYKDDLTGGAEYKKYIAKELCNELKEAL